MFFESGVDITGAGAVGVTGATGLAGATGAIEVVGAIEVAGISGVLIFSII